MQITKYILLIKLGNSNIMSCVVTRPGSNLVFCSDPILTWPCKILAQSTTSLRWDSKSGSMAIATRYTTLPPRKDTQKLLSMILIVILILQIIASMVLNIIGSAVFWFTFTFLISLSLGLTSNYGSSSVSVFMLRVLTDSMYVRHQNKPNTSLII